ncbi:MAG: anhydro-N-acetylmuramic acid kinase [Roseivirga sp.]
MSDNSYRVIGLMSGTSLDGLDIACCQFELKEGNWHFFLGQTESIAYSAEFQQRLKASVSLSAVELLLLNNEFGRYTGELVKTFLDKYSLEVDFVASHGHTVFHQIDKRLTYQIGAGQELANHTAQRVICDFRTLDVSLGGHGAPLVPIGDELLFAEYDFCLNLGGISNASFRYKDCRMAFDIAPANMLLSHILLPTGLPYDDGGQLARTGTVDQPLLDKLNGLDFYQQPFPKSLGYEWFCESVIPLIDGSDASIENKLCTGIQHIAYQIAESLKAYASNGARMMVTGGGAKNHYLTEVLQQYLGEAIEVVIPEESIIDFKEAIVFALMGVLRLRGENNCLSSVTGASGDCSGGVIYEPH